MQVSERRLSSAAIGYCSVVSQTNLFELEDFWTGSSITKDFVDAVPSYSATLFVMESVILLATIINTFRRFQAKQAGTKLKCEYLSRIQQGVRECNMR
jgi:hypothetical protein